MHEHFLFSGDCCQLPFADLCTRDERYQSYFTRKTYQRSQCVRSEGEKISHFGIVTNGILKAVNQTLDGTELCSAYFEARDVFPEFLYFSGDRFYTYSLYAEKASAVVWIPVTVMEEMLSEDPQLLYALLLHVCQRGLKNQLYLHCLNYQTIRERIAYWIVGMHNIAPNEAVRMPYSQSVLANMLHVSRSSLNQELKLMEKEGFFRIVKKEMRNVDLARLQRLA